MAIKKSGFNIDIDKIPQAFAGIQALSNVPPGATWDVLAGNKTVDQSLDDTANRMKNEQFGMNDQMTALPSIVPEMDPRAEEYFASLGIGGMAPISPDFGMTPPVVDTPVIPAPGTDPEFDRIMNELNKAEGYGMPDWMSNLFPMGEAGTYEDYMKQIEAEATGLPDFSSVISPQRLESMAGSMFAPTGQYPDISYDLSLEENLYALFKKGLHRDPNTGEVDPSIPAGTFFLHQLKDDPASVYDIGPEMYINYFYDNENMFDDNVAKGIEDFFKDRTMEDPFGAVYFSYDTYGENIMDPGMFAGGSKGGAQPAGFLGQAPISGELSPSTGFPIMEGVTPGGYVPPGPTGGTGI
jgi:hypothetical protein